MAKRAQNSESKQPANLTSDELNGAIKKIDRRLAEIAIFNFDNPTEDTVSQIQNIHRKIEGSLVEIFGADSLDYDRYKTDQPWAYQRTMFQHEPTIEEQADVMRKACHDYAVRLEAIKGLCEERLSDLGEAPGGDVTIVFEGLDLHPAIADATGGRFRSNHHADAVEAAVKALNNLVRLKAGVDDIDGMPLMQSVFGGKDPVLKFNEFADQNDRDEQQGFMFMFAGAVAGLRNPRAHRLMEDEPQRALEFIALFQMRISSTFFRV